MAEDIISYLDNIVASRLSIGVVVLDESGEILYLNKKARSILSVVNPGEVESSNGSVTLNMAVVDTIRNNLGSLLAAKSKCVHCKETKSSYALRALPLFKPQKKGKSCILVLIEGVAVNHTFDIEMVRKKFGLSKRETEVTYCLTEGMTNKEIANKLSLSPETVHDYVKQVMKKMGTTTRAGIVGKVLP